MTNNWPKGSRSSKLRRQARRAIPRQCFCGATGNVELDHIIGFAEGGTDTLDNLQWLCPEHHAEKTKAEQERGKARARARRGGHISKRYRDVEPHPMDVAIAKTKQPDDEPHPGAAS